MNILIHYFFAYWPIVTVISLPSMLLLTMFARIRIVVPTNYVDIVQSSRKTISYGRGQKDGNSYYKWPAWIPIIGVKTTSLPVSIFPRKLIDYAAYDLDRVPFVIDVVGFFRISDSNAAAERVSNFDELEEQLEPILQGAARTILATSSIDEILGSRAVFAEKFTTEVTKDLTSWGVEPVKSIELMDIRDAQGSQVISNIMAKKKSFIEMESRVAVAHNMQQAQTAEISAKREVAMNQQQAEEQVGMRTAQKDAQIGIQQQKAQQVVKEEEALTAQKQVAAQTVAEVGAATIAKQVLVVESEAAKQKQVLAAEGTLAAAKLNAEGVQANGLAKAAAEQALQLAPVSAQITLAKEIGENQGYQTYLISIRGIEAQQAVGIQQAMALQKAEVKIIAQSGKPADGATSVMDLFGASGGTRLGAMMEAFKNTDAGKALLNGSGNDARA